MRCLASIVYHSDNLRRIARSNPRHPFNSIAILNDGATLLELKKLVTIKKSSKLSLALGVPPHVETLKKLDAVVRLLIKEHTCRKKWEENFASMLRDNINEVALDAGQITRPKMVEIMEEHTRGLKETFKDDMEGIIRKYFSGNFSNSDNSADPPIENNQTNANSTSMLYSSYTHSGKIGLHTCKGWEFPSCQLKQAWRFWLIGQPDFEIRKENSIIEKCPVRPFCLFSLRHLLPRFKKTYQIS